MRDTARIQHRVNPDNMMFFHWPIQCLGCVKGQSNLLYSPEKTSHKMLKALDGQQSTCVLHYK